MNSCDTRNNLLFLTNEQQSINTFYEHCLQYTKQGKIVLLLTDQTKELLPILKAAKINDTELKRFVVINIDTLDACIQKLCEQHDWAWKPSLIIVDLRTILPYTALKYSNNNVVADLNTTEGLENAPNCFQQLALCIANLFGYYQSVLKRIEKQTAPNSSVLQTVFSILIVNAHPQYLTSKQIDLIINLYFYKNNAFDSLQELLVKIGLTAGSGDEN